MRIAIVTKIENFTDDLVQYWQGLGHQVKREKDFSEDLGAWMDCALFDFVGYELAEASTSVWSYKPMIGRLNRIEYHADNISRYKFDWSRVKALVFVSRWYLELAKSSYPEIPRNLFTYIPNGIDTNRFSFRVRDGSGFNIAWVAKKLDWNKNPIAALEVLYSLATETGEDWQLHLKGASGDSVFYEWKDYLSGRFSSIRDRVTFYPEGPNVNEWLEPMDYVLSTSMVESFHYVVGEGMAKGIKPLVHCWAGSLETWPRENIWLSHQELLRIVQGPYNSELYRQFIEEHYSLKRMADNLEEVLTP